MDASLYNDYILTLLFVKYLSDRVSKICRLWLDNVVARPVGCARIFQGLPPQLHSPFHKSPNTFRIWFDISYRRAVGDGNVDGAHDSCANTKHDEDYLELSHKAASLV